MEVAILNVLMVQSVIIKGFVYNVVFPVYNVQTRHTNVYLVLRVTTFTNHYKDVSYLKNVHRMYQYQMLIRSNVKYVCLYV